MVTYEEIKDKLEEIAPLSLAQAWDNSGFQILIKKDGFERIGICLDITEKVIDFAIKNKVDMLIAHHPMYFTAKKSIICGDLVSDYSIRLIQNGISVYASHTCFDSAKGGTNSYLAELLQLEDIHYFDEKFENAIGVYGKLVKTENLKGFAHYLADKLDMPASELRIVGDKKKKIQSVGICTGSGMSEISTSISLGCDVFITGDVKYHDALTASEKGFLIIDAGHFHTEKFFVDNLHSQLDKAFGKKIKILSIKESVSPFQNLNSMLE